jgi:hypothetical protein
MPTPILSDVQVVTYTPAGGSEVDLSCWITEPPTDEVSFDTVETPTLCNPQASVVKVGPRTLTLTLLWADGWDTDIEPLFGTDGLLTWFPAGAAGASYEYNVVWPSTYGIAAPFGEAISVEVQLGVTDRTAVPAP